MANNIIEILNNDTNVQKFMKKAAIAAEKTGVTIEEWNKAKEALMCMAIQMCPEAMALMAKETYEACNERRCNNA